MSIVIKVYMIGGDSTISMGREETPESEKRAVGLSNS